MYCSSNYFFFKPFDSRNNTKIKFNDLLRHPKVIAEFSFGRRLAENRLGLIAAMHSIQGLKSTQSRAKLFFRTTIQ